MAKIMNLFEKEDFSLKKMKLTTFDYSNGTSFLSFYSA